MPGSGSGGMQATHARPGCSNGKGRENPECAPILPPCFFELFIVAKLPESWLESEHQEPDMMILQTWYYTWLSRLSWPRHTKYGTKTRTFTAYKRYAIIVCEMVDMHRVYTISAYLGIPISANLHWKFNKDRNGLADWTYSKLFNSTGPGKDDVRNNNLLPVQRLLTYTGVSPVNYWGVTSHIWHCTFSAYKWVRSVVRDGYLYSEKGAIKPFTSVTSVYVINQITFFVYTGVCDIITPLHK